jgi:hypothetical protein
VEIERPVEYVEDQDILDAVEQATRAPVIRVQANIGEQTKGRKVEATVQGATSEEGVGNTLTVTIENLPDNLGRQIQSGGWVRVRAGYQGNDTGINVPPSTALYLGQVQHAFRLRRDGNPSWRIRASSSTEQLRANISRSVVSFQKEAEPPTVGEFARDAAASVGATFEPTAAATGEHPEVPAGVVRLERNTTVETRQAKALLEGSAREVSARIRKSNRVQGARPHRLGTLPEKPMGFFMVDTSEPVFGGRRIMDLPLNQVTNYTAEPEARSPDIEVTVPSSVKPERKLAIQSEQAEKTSIGYRFAGPLDPRISPGTTVAITDPEGQSGLAVVESVRHEVGERWRTQWTGAFAATIQNLRNEIFDDVN